MVNSCFRPCLLLCFCLAMLRTHAQLTVFAGPQITSAKYIVRGADQSTSGKTGFNAGVGLKTLLEGPLYFSPMLYYNQKGYKVTFDRRAFPPDSAAKNNNVTVRAIELAPLFQVNFSKKASYGFVRFGPSADFAVKGRETFDSLNNKRISRDMVFSFGDYSFVTLSANVQLGFQHKSGFAVFAHYQHGVTNLNNADYGPTIFYRVAGLSVAYTLGKKPW